MRNTSPSSHTCRRRTRTSKRVETKIPYLHSIIAPINLSVNDDALETAISILHHQALLSAWQLYNLHQALYPVIADTILLC